LRALALPKAAQIPNFRGPVRYTSAWVEHPLDRNSNAGAFCSQCLPSAPGRLVAQTHVHRQRRAEEP
jgi:hypothetical protein